MMFAAVLAFMDAPSQHARCWRYRVVALRVSVGYALDQPLQASLVLVVVRRGRVLESLGHAATDETWSRPVTAALPAATSRGRLNSNA
jgi:hypothetical protein